MEETENCRASGYEDKCFNQVITLLKSLGEGFDADTHSDGVRYLHYVKIYIKIYMRGAPTCFGFSQPS